jgi:hypothetical protein
MKFLDKLNNQWSLLDEADDTQALAPDATADAAAPDPNATPEPAADTTAQVAPEGYVGLVKLLSKAAAMTFPAGALDEIYRTDITAENAFPMQTALEAAIKQNEMYSDNPERLDNVNVKKFISSINTGNFINKYKQILAAMNKQDPYLKSDVNL